MQPKRKRFSILWFTASVIVQVGLVLFVVHQWLPGLWQRQADAGWLRFISLFLVHCLVLGFFEVFFHRYVLHKFLTNWYRHMTLGHGEHHQHTFVVEVDREPDGKYILSRYEITEEDQYENSSFPPYAIAAFCLLFSPFLVIEQLLLPNWPVFLAGYGSIVWQMWGYETIHALLHQPYERWKFLTEHPLFGQPSKAVYGHHLIHHRWPTLYNDGVFGFFGYQLADRVLGLYSRAKNLLLNGRKATADDYDRPTPSRLIRWLDSLAKKRQDAMYIDAAKKKTAR